ncbi:TetR/AcrR family transcriptional repressor of nem operon [Flavobacterium arsenatis]|uniref:TetR/AcrR family transcriptional repressor of nem operon n=1 Tax=Flavobacterium arsenatis TaxID=1484332 RepID=A0ABU1TQ54_9FLAO|nr:TetR/AcrR family transcriptional regulator [Flavobacterium arsenatis]MDR6968087.1 TetR/AcrR family transcriptional repressor of nem operon [Flavobacterium arsenatis]
MARTKVFDENDVLDKAMNLFWQKGYNATSAQDLVDNLGISRSSLYDTYGDKHSLFVKALKQYRKERVDPVLQEADVVEDVEAYIRFFFESVQKEALSDNSSKGCFIINSVVELAPVDSEIAGIANSIMNDTEEALCKVIKKGQDTGVFTTKFSARSLARFVFNSLNGLRVTVKFDADKKMFDDIVNVCLSALRV